MTPPVALADDTARLKMDTLHQDFEAITITGYYTRDIRFPVFPDSVKGVDHSDQTYRPLYKTRDLMP